MQQKLLPVYGVTLGSHEADVPTFGVFGGVHGLERVGCHVAISWLESVCSRLSWDKSLRHALENSRLISIPLVNPGGLFLESRSNPNGVDLMRNAPVESLEATSFLVGGHRFGRWLPWYRGREDRMEDESASLVEFVRQFTFASPSFIGLDCHSGFGLVDRVWFPYAKTTKQFPGHQAVESIRGLLETAHPHHPYIIEPQSSQYTTHGDLWDLLYDEWKAQRGEVNSFIPFTLEMGSWSWVRKNPRQLFSSFGAFNPTIPHRYKRTMRRHLFLLDTLWSIARSPEHWSIGLC